MHILQVLPFIKYMMAKEEVSKSNLTDIIRSHLAKPLTKATASSGFWDVLQQGNFGSLVCHLCTGQRWNVLIISLYAELRALYIYK